MSTSTVPSGATATAAFLDATSPRYIGGFLEMSNARLYGFRGT